MPEDVHVIRKIFRIDHTANFGKKLATSKLDSKHIQWGRS
jgi:hypothetical protein